MRVGDTRIITEDNYWNINDLGEQLPVFAGDSIEIVNIFDHDGTILGTSYLVENTRTRERFLIDFDTIIMESEDF